MLYFYLKTIHIICAAIIVGMALSTSLLLVFTHQDGPAERMMPAVDRWLRLNGLVVLPLLLIQMVLGFSIVTVRQYALTTPWLAVTFIGFLLLMLTWLSAGYSLLRYKNQSGDPAFYRAWRNRCLAAVVILMVIVFMMANRPG